MSAIHCVGIGGIGVSALAKWLVHLGYRVTGSDGREGEQVQYLRELGVSVSIGADPQHVPADAELLVYSSAVPEQHPERLEARSRGIQEMNSFALLGELTKECETLVVAGTHGKSTTTAMICLALIDAGLDPTCFVGSIVPGFPQGNVRFGNSELVVIEGDEYDRHFLHFSPTIVVINNLEWDHTDIYPTYADLVIAFQQLLQRVRDRGTVCFNADDPRVVELMAHERPHLERRGIRLTSFGLGAHAEAHVRDLVVRDGAQHLVFQERDGRLTRTKLTIPGKMNVSNALATFSAARALGVEPGRIGRSLEAFPGIWRRFERIKDEQGILVISDYAHHPTAVKATLEAAKSFYSGRRIIACYQPHQRARTQALFWEYIPSFDAADIVILTPIWDALGREGEYEVTSADIVREIQVHDCKRHITRLVEEVDSLEGLRARLAELKRRGDVVLLMGAGNIYTIASEV